MFDWLLWFIVGWLFAIVIYVSTGPLLIPKLPDKWGQKVADFYLGQVMLTLDRAVLARRKHGGFDLFASDYDVSKESEKLKIGGKTRHFEDPRGLISRLSNKTFGVVDERYNIFSDPMVADIADHVHEYTSDEEHISLVRMQENEPEEICFTRFMPMSIVPRSVDIANSVHLLSGSANPDLTSTVEEYTRLSQEGFKRADLVFVGSLGFLFAIGFGMVFLAYYMGAPEEGSSISLTAMPMGWLA